MPRQTRDANLQSSVAMPAAGATANSPSIDLGAVSPGDAAEHFEGIIEIPAIAALADAKNLVFTVQDSADNASFATVAAVATKTVTGAGGVGNAAANYRFRLPSGVRRYIRYAAVLDAAGGSITGTSVTMSLLF